MVPPLPEGPLSQLKLMLGPRHCEDTRGRGGVNRKNAALIQTFNVNIHKTQKDHTSLVWAKPQIYSTYIQT